MMLATPAGSAQAAPSHPDSAVTKAATAGPNAGSCTHWQDSNTYGYGCKGYPAGYYVQAWAHCMNGKYVHGNDVPASGSSYHWSYAYCTSVNSSLLTGWYVISQ